VRSLRAATRFRYDRQRSIGVTHERPESRAPHTERHTELANVSAKGVPMARVDLQRVILAGTYVRLEPLSLTHVDELQAAGSSGEIWRWLPSAHHTDGSMRAFVEDALRLESAGLALPFAIVERTSARAVGSTRYHAIEPEHRRLEIGFTWLALGVQRTPVNTESKWLLLRHAFETLRYRRVELKVDADNARSRAAVLQLGAREEGYFRKHMLYPDGRNRDSVYYSIVDDEWPAVAEALRKKLICRDA